MSLAQNEYVRDTCLQTNKLLEKVSNYRKEEAVKQAVHQNYVRQLESSIDFKSAFIDILTKNIDDENILVELLNLNLYDIDFDLSQRKRLADFLVFLHEYYSEDQIFDLFKDIDMQMQEHQCSEYLYQTLEYFHEIKNNVLYEYFKVVPCNILSFYNEMYRCANDKRINEHCLEMGHHI